ncbi:TetR/AcrR family transcriptional regulator [Actinocorallia populi]|uniref:TetR/AcrR family transcriptional regulator n=1 Tax=Actinocorallia populi TaxID=2079200 RepID=UPI000D08BF73|nr:TetR/AcrR family transcriptional regulator [Actinocorallia populi]
METRQRLLDAAARVFSRHGYAAGTTNRIAEEAGHSIGSLYQYFPNKDAILAELAGAHAEEGIARLRRRFEEGAPPNSLEGRLRMCVRIAIDLHRDDAPLHRVIFEEAPRTPEFLRMVHEAEEEFLEALQALLAADPEVTVADVPMAARLVVTTVEGAVHRIVTHDPPDDLERLENALVTMLMRYLTN